MAKKTYHGSCHCGRVTFEVELDLSAGTSKCNCTFCWKGRRWNARSKPDEFRALSGTELLSGYRPGAERGHGGFCKECGVTPFQWVDAAEWNEGEYVSINVTALDDLDPSELLSAPVQYCDGRNNNWWSPPAETRHL